MIKILNNIEDIMKKPCRIHFVGIGGISMSGLAEILLDKGYLISGSDSKESAVTKHLESLGAKISYEHRAKNISNDISYLVYTAAVKVDNPELTAANELGITIMTRAVLLGQIMSNYPSAISVSGTHGKTTTTSMLSQIMLEAKYDPTILVGGILKSIHGNVRVGHSDYFITEACEYTNSFHSFISTIDVILNIREDHMDFFKDLDEIRKGFKIFADKLDENGVLVINSGIEQIDYFTNDLKCRYVTFGLDKNKSKYYPENINYNQLACASFDIMMQDDNCENGDCHFNESIKVAHVDLNVPGEYNILNALAAFATARIIGISEDLAAYGLNRYTGTDRRFEYKGEMNGVTIIDDYAHHPDEIEATLTAARNYPHKKLWCVFQPHTYSRTKAFITQFANSLSLADEIVLAEIYPARETDNLGISSKTLYDKIKEPGKSVHYFSSFNEIETFLKENCLNGDLLITMGAGDVVLIGENLLK